MAGKRASSRTNILKKNSRTSTRSAISITGPEIRRPNSRTVAGSPAESSSKRKRDSRNIEPHRRHKVTTKRTASPHSELSNNSATETHSLLDTTHSPPPQGTFRIHRKRKRVAEKETHSNRCQRSRTRCDVLDSEGDILGAFSQPLSNDLFFPTEQEQSLSYHNQSPEHTTTGSNISKRPRGKARSGVVSGTDFCVTDPPRHIEVNEVLLPPISTPSVTHDMPADFSDQPQKPSTTTKMFTRSSQLHTESEVPCEGSSGGASNWFRSFACFSTNGDGDQTLMELTGPSSSSSKGFSSATASVNNRFHSDGIVFTNPVQSVVGTAPVDVAGPSHSSGGGGAVLRFATAGSSSSSRRRGHRGNSSRVDASSAFNSSSGAKGGANRSSGGLGSLFSFHHHHGHSHSQQPQNSGINQCILQLQQTFGDVDAQVALLQEINQTLLMGSEESLAGTAARNLVSVILELLDADESVAKSMAGDGMVELKNLCCNILAHLMDVIPKAADAVVMAIPILLNTISCSFVGDILERIINVLEQVSRRHGRQVLLYGGVTAVMGYYDFVTVAQHRTILSMVANCFVDVRKEDFEAHILDCLPSLCERLSSTSTSEPRCIERVCLCFARLVEAFKDEPRMLRDIASFGLCQNLQQLICASPPIVSNMKDIAYMLATLCNRCPDLSLDLLKLGYTETLYTLLTEQKPPEFDLPPAFEKKEAVEEEENARSVPATAGLRCTASRSNIARALENRGIDNVCALLQVVSALLPPMPSNSHSSPDGDNSSLVSLEEDVRDLIFQQQCKLFEEAIKRRNEDHQCAKAFRGVQFSSSFEASALSSPPDFPNKLGELFFVKAVHILLPMLFDLYVELNGISPRLRCIESIQRMVYFSSPACLAYTVSPRSVSAMVAGMLSSPEFAIIAAGLKLANLFITRIPLVFSAYFRKEGVLFHLQRLAYRAAENPLSIRDEEESSPVPQVFFPPSSSSEQTTSFSSKPDVLVDHRLRSGGLVTAGAQLLRLRTTNRGKPKTSVESQSFAAVPLEPSPILFVQPPSISSASSSSTTPSYGGDTLVTEEIDSPQSTISRSSSTSTLDMDRVAAPSSAVVLIESVRGPSEVLPSPLLAMAGGHRDSNLRTWITDQCEELLNRIQELAASTEPPNHQPSTEKPTLAARAASRKSRKVSGGTSEAHNLLPHPVVARDLVPNLEAVSRLLLCPNDPCSWVLGLRQLGSMLLKSEDEAPSPFEVQHSGLLESMRAFLDSPTERRLRIYLLLRIFVGERFTEHINLKQICESQRNYEAVTKAIESIETPQEQVFPYLVNCLLNCLHQQEHFHVLVGPTSHASTAETHAEEMYLGASAGETPVSSLPATTVYHHPVGTDHNKNSSSSGVGGSRPPRSKAHRASVPVGGGGRSMLPRQWANLVPGFLKLEIVFSDEEQQHPASSGSSRKNTHDASLTKNTFWEHAPPTIPLHVNALITAQNLQRLLIQRIFIASLVSTSSEDFDRQDVFIPPPPPPPSRSATASSNHTSPSDNNSSSHQQRRRLCRRHHTPTAATLNSCSTTPSTADDDTLKPGPSSAPYNLRHEKASAAVAVRPNTLVEHQIELVEAGARASFNRLRENSSRPKSMSLLAAFGMLQFSSDSHQQAMSVASTATSDAAAAPSSSATSSSSPHAAAASATSSSSKSKREGRHSAQSSRHLHRQSALFAQHGVGASRGVASEFMEAANSMNNHLSTSLVPVFYVNGHRISNHMPLYQAVRTHSAYIAERARQLLSDYRFSMTEQNREDIINSFIWRNVHVVHYRLEKVRSRSQDNWFSQSSSSNHTESLSRPFPFLKPFGGSLLSSSSSRVSPTSPLSAAISCLKRPRGGGTHDQQTSAPPASSATAAANLRSAGVTSSRLLAYLESIPEAVTFGNDRAYLTTTLSVLRALYGLSEVGNSLDEVLHPFPIISANHFLSQKLSVKASRQLQDVFCVLAGNLPDWLVQMLRVCPFLFPFSVRQSFFYVHNFDRDRAILRLQDSIANGSMNNNSSAPGGDPGANDNALPSPHLAASNSPLQGSFSGRFAIRGGSSSQSHHHHRHSTLMVLESLVDSAAQIQRHKITVNRDPKYLMRAAESSLSELRNSRAILEIAFEGEVGFGLGPTLEFYTLVSHQLLTANLDLWHGHDITPQGYLITPPPGLYPRPLAKNARVSVTRDIRAKFFFLGQLMARALLDWRQLDISLSPTLFKWFLYTVSPEEDFCLGSSRVGVTAADLFLIDPQFARHHAYLLKLHRRRARDLSAVKKIDSEIDDLGLHFTLPGYSIDLCRNGGALAVTGSNLGDYLHGCASWFLVEGVRRQITALLEGFDSVLPGVRVSKLANLFRPDECEGLFCGAASAADGGLYRDQMAAIRLSDGCTKMLASELLTPGALQRPSAGWEVDTLMQSCICDHGYTLQSRAIQFLFEVMAEFDGATRRLFIQFVTGSPRLPIGGFRALKPPLKIVMKREAEEHADNHLPSVMTCQNYLKLPNYSSKEIMRQKLIYAIHEGQHAFHLS